MNSLFTTRTFWFNAITAVGLILALPEFMALIPVTWVKYIVFLQAIGNILLRYVTTTPVKSITGGTALLVLALSGSLLGLPACTTAGTRAPILVAQTGSALTASIGEISRAATQLQQASVLPAAAALSVQEGLLRANAALGPLPTLLRTIDAAQQAGALQQGDVEKAIAILQAVAPEISTLLTGVPVTETTKALITLVRAAQQTTTTVLLELAKLRQP